MTDKNPIVVMKGITIEFPGVKALDGVDLTLYRRSSRPDG